VRTVFGLLEDVEAPVVNRGPDSRSLFASPFRIEGIGGGAGLGGPRFRETLAGRGGIGGGCVAVALAGDGPLFGRGGDVLDVFEVKPGRCGGGDALGCDVFEIDDACDVFEVEPERCGGGDALELDDGCDVFEFDEVELVGCDEVELDDGRDCDELDEHCDVVGLVNDALSCCAARRCRSSGVEPECECFCRFVALDNPYSGSCTLDSLQVNI
jgi:hypothetical protein